MRRTFRVLSNRNLRRVGWVGALAALAAVLLLAGGGGAGRADAAGSTCVKHSKRVVKHVKRHGKRAKVVRFKHYWTCTEAPAPAPAPATPSPTPAPVTTAPAPAPTPSPTPEPEPKEPEANAVSIRTDDHTDPYEYEPSRTTVKAGRLLVQLNNMGSEDDHNMEMERLGEDGEPEGPPIAMVSAEHGRASGVEPVEVRPGQYRMWCTIGHHAEHGMKATITVVE